MQFKCFIIPFFVCLLQKLLKILKLISKKDENERTTLKGLLKILLKTRFLGQEIVKHNNY